MSNSIEKYLEEKLGWFVNRRLKKFRGIHQGESCYIFGDGPSISWFDLKYFNNYPAICSGLLPFHNDFGSLDVKYCLMIEPRLFLPKFLQNGSKHNILYESITKEYRTFVIKRRDINIFVHLTNFLSLLGCNVNYVFRGIPKDESESGRLLDKINLFEGSFHASLTLAYYLGFTKIYLVGFDGWVIHPSRPSGHWYEFGDQSKSKNVLIVDLATDFLDIIGLSCEVSTIAVDGDSRNVRYIEYESYTGRTPIYRENYELLDQSAMRLLATYPGYNMYPEKDSWKMQRRKY